MTCVRCFDASTLILGAYTEEHFGDSIVLTLMGKIEYDSRFDMIYVVPFEMIYDEFRVVVA